MKHSLMALITLLAGAAALAPVPAVAQNLNAMVQNQVRLQQQGDRAAMNAAQAYYNYALRLRAMGYKGEISTGVTAQSLNDANAALVRQGQINSQAQRANATCTFDSINSTNNAITRGCTTSTWVGYRYVCQ